MAAKKNDEFSLEQAFGQLEELVSALENPQITLEDAVGKWQSGMELVKKCEEQIDLAEKKVLVLSEEGNTDEF